MAVNRYYSSTAQEATLTNSVNSSATILPVSGVTGFPVSYPYTLILDRGTISEEIVTVTSAVGTNLTVTRGQDGTSAVSHSLGATVAHGVSARDHREAQEHIAASSGVHGITGSVVGTTDTQTLINKTLTSPTVSGGSWASVNLTGQPTLADYTNAQHDHGDADDAGNIPQASVTGLSARLTSIEGVNTTQDTNISANTTSISGNTTSISNHESRITALEALDPIEQSDTTSITTITSTSYAPGSPVVGFTFVAPPSGKVFITISGNVQQNNNGWHTALSYELKTGGTIGSGTSVQVGAFTRAVVAGQGVTSGGPAYASASKRGLVTGLTAGNTYNVRAVHRVTGGSGELEFRSLTVEPVTT